MIRKYNLATSMKQVDQYWDPYIVASLNGQHVKLAKIKGPFVWHAHEDEDEMFLVLHGSFDMELEDQTIHLSEGDMVVIPRGTIHRPHARQEAHILLFEPIQTVNTGNARSEFTRTNLKYIQ